MNRDKCASLAMADQNLIAHPHCLHVNMFRAEHSIHQSPKCEQKVLHVACATDMRRPM